MSANDQSEKREAAEKSTIIERIIFDLEPLGVDASAQRRKPDLDLLTKDELQQLAQRLKGAPDGQQAISLIVRAITDSDEARRKADDEKYSGGGPAKVKMNPS